MDYKKLSEILFPYIDKTTDYYENIYSERNINENAIVTRFAPSPTGFIHMGSLYTAYISSIFAKQTNGVFYLRIEDTDQIRKIENGINIIVNGLSKCGLNFDEGVNEKGNYGPYIQSERKEIYQTYAKKLVAEGLAYPCFCSKEELSLVRESQEKNKNRLGYYGEFAKCRSLSYDEIILKINKGEPYVVRLKSLGNYDKKIECRDLIKGKIEFPENDLDVVILKADGLPTYHFAHAIDDHLMHTTHVIRGDEWLPSLPLHYQLFHVLNFKVPKYAHLSPLMKKEGNGIRKLSKRKDPEAAIDFYYQMGLPVEALLLYFKTLMNSNYEMWYLQNEPKKPFKFEFNKMTTGGTLFDLSKLLNISKTYLSKITAYELYNSVILYLRDYDKEFLDIFQKDKNYSISLLNIEREYKKPRKDIATYGDVKKQYWYFYDEYYYKTDKKFDNISFSKYSKGLLLEYLENYYDISDNKDEWYEKIKEVARKYNYSDNVREYKDNPEIYIGHIGDVCEMIRVALTSQIDSPDIFEIMIVMGIERIKKRFTEFSKYLDKNI